jgi:hypothetical protein
MRNFFPSIYNWSTDKRNKGLGRAIKQNTAVIPNMGNCVSGKRLNILNKQYSILLISENVDITYFEGTHIVIW